MGLEKLFKQRLSLNKKKFFIVRSVWNAAEHISMKRLRCNLNKLKGIINEERKLTAAMKKELKLLKGFGLDITPLKLQLSNIAKITSKQLSVIRHIKIFKFLQVSTVRKFETFLELSELERENNRIFYQLLTEKLSELKDFEKHRKTLTKNKQHLRKLHTIYLQLPKLDVKKAKQKSKELLDTINILKKTEVYGYIKEDMDTIEKKIKYVMKHPKENTLSYLLAGVYIISPGTFELTFVYLSLRYAKKMTIDRIYKGQSRNL